MGFSRALAAVRRTVAARRDAKRRARAVRIPPCSPCIVCRKNKKQRPARCCLWRRRWDSNPRDIAVKLISSATPSTSWVMLLIVIPQNLLRKKERKVGENSKYLIVENSWFLTTSRWKINGSFQNACLISSQVHQSIRLISLYSALRWIVCFLFLRLFLIFWLILFYMLPVVVWATFRQQSFFGQHFLA